MIFQAQAQIGKVETMVDGGNKLVVYTQELPPNAMAEMFALKGKAGHFLFSESNITDYDIPTEEVKVETFKGDRTPSQKLRGTMHVFWEQKTNQAEDFDTQWYPRQMELMRQRFLEGLDK